jgi:hypothetical protein
MTTRIACTNYTNLIVSLSLLFLREEKLIRVTRDNSYTKN